MKFAITIFAFVLVNLTMAFLPINIKPSAVISNPINILTKNCTKYPTFQGPISKILGLWKLVRTTVSNYTCLTVTFSYPLQLSDSLDKLLPITLNVTYNDGVKYRIKTYVMETNPLTTPGRFILKHLPTDEPVEQTLAGYELLVLNVTDNTLSLNVCNFKLLTDYKPFHIFTKDGEYNPEVGFFESEAERIEIPLGGIRTTNSKHCFP